MKNLLYTILMLSAVGCVTSCSGSHESRGNLGAARTAGYRRALSLHPDSIARTSPGNTDMADNPSLQASLLDIRRREAALRSAGHPQAAEVYISTFLTTLDSVNPALAAELR